MVDRLSVLFVVISVAALFGIVFGHQPRFCSTSSWGNVTGSPSEKPYHVFVGPGVVKWKVFVPDICDLGPVGTTVTACETDEAPFVTFYNQSTVYIKRSGNVWVPGSVDIKIFCQKSNSESIVSLKPASDESSETDDNGLNSN